MGVGIHGGFGNTHGSKLISLIKVSYSKKGTLTQVKANHTRDSLIKEIDGFWLYRSYSKNSNDNQTICMSY